jgi:hypothetical protein
MDQMRGENAVRSTFLSAGVICLSTATFALAQAPGAVPLPPPSPLLMSVPSYPLPSSPTGCLTNKCATEKPCCTPEVKPAKKTVYSSVTREYCLPTRSILDTLLAKCGLSDECEGPVGEPHTKTLLVKKVVTKCEEPACAVPGSKIIEMPAIPQRISTIPQR